MSRSNYSDELDYDTLNLYRANVDRSLAGKRGQAFLREMLAAMDAMPEKRLIANALEMTTQAARRNNELLGVARYEAGVCAIGSVGRARSYDLFALDPNDTERIGKFFGIATCMAAEIEYINDELGLMNETPEQRFIRVRAWVEGLLLPDRISE